MSTIVEPVAPPRPAPDEPRPYSFPAFESRTLPNGLRVIVAPVTKLPVASVLGIIDAGAGLEPHDREGVAQLTAKALIEGTATRDGAAITDEAERLGGASPPPTGMRPRLRSRS
jgi:zinc protease